MTIKIVQTLTYNTASFSHNWLLQRCTTWSSSRHCPQVAMSEDNIRGWVPNCYYTSCTGC